MVETWAISHPMNARRLLFCPRGVNKPSERAERGLSIDRVIDGVHFGKRWKHYVRNAQQFLKRTGRVYYDGDRWHMTQRV